MYSIFEALTTTFFIHNMIHEVPRFTKTEFRQIHYLLYFVLFIIMFQVFQYTTTRRATKKYKELFRQATEIVVHTNSISFETANIHRSILNLSFTIDSSEVKKFRQSLFNSEDTIVRKLGLIEDKIIRYNLYSLEKTLSFEELKAANKSYRLRYQKYLAMLKTISGEDKLYYRRMILRPALESFQKRHDNFLLNVFSDQQKAADAIADEADRTGFNLLIGGNILLLAIAIILVYIIVSERKKVV
jgi:hypothetical protein